MQNQELVRQQQRLENLFKRTRQATGEDIEMQSHWAKYLCVLCAGFIENAYSEIYCDFVKRAASEPVAKYATSQISRTQNPKIDKFVEISRAFNVGWAEELEEYIAEEGRKEAINSIMSNRHLIAHGQHSGISIVRLRDWYRKSLDVLEHIERQLG